ncbi:protein phosphatase 4, regulatory subunit 2 [Mortierella sp. NVP85]|nr:protein phosphatase 4, regulatory subunit 2 [Mortierella sp. NVP85]
MTEQDQSSSTDGIALIQQIALTNQVNVPWDELKIVLKQRLDQVLESKMLTYTEPTVTNPPAPTAAVSNVPSKENTPQERTEDPDQANASNHIKETAQHQTTHEDTNNQNGSAEQKGREATETASGPSPETKAEAQAEGQGLPEGTAETPTNDTIHNNQGVEANGPTATVVAEPEDTEGLSENGTKMVPMSKDTLLLETPEGYHERINGLLNVFTSPPFTIQRVCELLLNPTEHHANLIKYLRAVEKVLMITSSINEFSNPAYNGPSALDEDTESKKAAVTVNGDYSKAKALDFDLITDTSATSELTDAKEQGAHIEDKDGQDGKLQESAKGAEETTGTSASDMDVDTVVGAAMDGVETDVKVDSETDGGMDVDQP